MIKKPEQVYGNARRQLYYQWTQSEHHIYQEPVYDHTREYIESLEVENAKLRELVRNLWPFVKAGLVSACPNRECCLFEECDAGSEYECLIEEHMAGRTRELGVEVSE